MEKKKWLAAALAATLMFGVAPYLERDGAQAPGVWMATAQAASPKAEEALYPLPVVTGTRSFTDADDKGELLLSRMAMINMGTEGTAQYQYPQMAEALGLHNDAEQERFFNTRKEMLGTAKEDRKDRFEQGVTTFYPYAFKQKVYVRRADDEVVSLLQYYEDYMGGAHGMYGVGGYNFDTRTGKALALQDVFADLEAMKAAIVKGLCADYPNASFMQGDNTATLTEYITEALRNNTLSWTMDHRGATFYFNPYHIGSYAEGIFTTTLLFDENPSLYRHTPVTTSLYWDHAGWNCTELMPYLPTRVAAGAEGKLTVSNDENSIIIEKGETLRDEMDSVREIYPTYLNDNNGYQQYVYVDYSPDGAIYRLRIYKVKGKSPERWAELPFTRRIPGTQADTARFEVLTDPENFTLYAVEGGNFQPGQRLQCRIDDNGMPVVIDAEGAKG